MAKILQGTAQNEPEGVSPLSPSGSTPDREQRISRIVDLVSSLSGDARETVVEDERKNLEAFLTEPYSDAVKAEVKAILK